MIVCNDVIFIRVAFSERVDDEVEELFFKIRRLKRNVRIKSGSEKS